MTERALALQVISGRCGLGQSGYHDTSPVTTLPDRDTTLAGVQPDMTVVALMIPALGIPVFYRGLTKWPCDLYKIRAKFITFIEIEAPKVQRCEKKEPPFISRSRPSIRISFDVARIFLTVHIDGAQVCKRRIFALLHSGEVRQAHGPSWLVFRIAKVLIPQKR